LSQSWRDYHTGMFDKIIGMRIDHVLVTTSLRHRVVWAEIDREARKGNPTLRSRTAGHRHRQPGTPFNAGRPSAELRVAARSWKQTEEK
jgi:exodeoxyribonuclease III